MQLFSKKVTLLFVSLWSFQSLALSVDLSKEIPEPVHASLFEVKSENQIKKLSELSQLKYFEMKSSEKDCDRLAPQLFSKHKSIKGWIALSWLRCTNKTISEKALGKVFQESELFYQGPWRQSLWNLWLEQTLNFIDLKVKKKNSLAISHIEKTLKFNDLLTKENKSVLFSDLGELYYDKKEFKRSLFYFEQSLNFKETNLVQDKISNLKKVLNVIESDKEASVKVESKLADKTISNEKEIEDRMLLSLKNNEPVAALKDAVELINSYPGSRVSKRNKDKALEIYNSLFDRGMQGPAGALDKALDILLDVEPLRLAEWSQAMHRRADYKASLLLSEKALKTLSNSSLSTSLLLTAGRSAHFLGLYDKAMQFYDELGLKHRGSDEATEALFRMGLIQYRLKSDAAAAVLFDKVLTEKKDRYDLIARYWLYRSLQRNQNQRAESVYQELISLYPFSYYGIRLRAENNNNKVSWQIDNSTSFLSSDKKIDSMIWLEGSQIDSWKRFKDLIKANWISEAQSELQEFPVSKNAEIQAYLGKKWSALGLSALAIKFLNEAMELDKNYRSEEYFRASYPQLFSETFNKEAAKNDVNKNLLMSLTRQESAFNLRAISTSSAYGLMQLIPSTAKEVAQKLGYKKLELPEDMFRPEINIAMGSFYIKEMLKQFNFSVPFALASYNAGPSRMSLWIFAREDVQKQMSQFSSSPQDEIWIDELPWTETSFYVKAILRNTLIYKLLESGEFDLSPVIWSELASKKVVNQ